MLAALIGLLSSLPQLLTMINSVWAALVKVSGNDPAGFIVKAGIVFDQLAKAETQEEYAASAKNLADLIAHLPAK